MNPSYEIKGLNQKSATWLAKSMELKRLTFSGCDYLWDCKIIMVFSDSRGKRSEPPEYKTAGRGPSLGCFKSSWNQMVSLSLFYLNLFMSVNYRPKSCMAYILLSTLVLSFTRMVGDLRRKMVSSNRRCVTLVQDTFRPKLFQDRQI